MTVSNLARKLLRRPRRNSAVTALAALDNRILDDIGIQRADIAAIARRLEG